MSSEKQVNLDYFQYDSEDGSSDKNFNDMTILSGRNIESLPSNELDHSSSQFDQFLTQLSCNSLELTPISNTNFQFSNTESDDHKEYDLDEIEKSEIFNDSFIINEDYMQDKSLRKNSILIPSPSSNIKENKDVLPFFPLILSNMYDTNEQMIEDNNLLKQKEYSKKQLFHTPVESEFNFTNIDIEKNMYEFTKNNNSHEINYIDSGIPSYNYLLESGNNIELLNNTSNNMEDLLKNDTNKVVENIIEKEILSEKSVLMQKKKFQNNQKSKHILSGSKSNSSHIKKKKSEASYKNKMKSVTTWKTPRGGNAHGLTPNFVNPKVDAGSFGIINFRKPAAWSRQKSSHDISKKD